MKNYLPLKMSKTVVEELTIWRLVKFLLNFGKTQKYPNYHLQA